MTGHFDSYMCRNSRLTSSNPLLALVYRQKAEVNLLTGSYCLAPGTISIIIGEDRSRTTA